MSRRPQLFADLSAPYYISAPPYRETSGGVRAMHYLCHALNLLGQEAYVDTDVVSTVLRTPTITEAIRRRHMAEGREPIAIYPEVIGNNYMQLRHVVRYLLNLPEKLTGQQVRWGADDLIYTHGHDVVPPGMKAELLQLPLVNSRIFNTDGAHDSMRSGKLLWIHRFIDQGGVPDARTEGFTEISFRVPYRSPEELARLYKGAEFLYTYEASTACYEALLCGCPVVYLPNDIMLPRPMHNYLTSAGSAWGDDAEQLAFAQRTVKDIPGIYAGLEDQFWGEIERFIDVTQDRARSSSPRPRPLSPPPSAEASPPMQTVDATAAAVQAFAAAKAKASGPRKRRLVVCAIEVPQSCCPQIRLFAPFSFFPEEWELVWGIVNLEMKFETLQSADAILLHRLMPGACDLDTLQAIFKLGKPVIYETDDLLTEVPANIPFADSLSRGKAGIEYAIRNANAVIVSTQFLADKYRHMNPNIHVLVNFLDFDRFYRPVPLRSPEKVSIGLVGTSLIPYNFALVEAALRTLCKRYPGRIRLCFIGHQVPPGWESHPAVEYQPVLQGYHAYTEWLLAQQLDIALVPLVDDSFNNGKSVIKWMEYSAAGVASVFSDVATYRSVVDNGRNGLLVKQKPEAWLTAIESLIADPASRRQIARTAQAEVRKYFSLRENALRYHRTYLHAIGAHEEASAVVVADEPARVPGVLVLDGEGSPERVGRSLRSIEQGPYSSLPVIVLTTQAEALPEWTDSLRYVPAAAAEYAEAVEQFCALADFDWVIIIEAGQ